MKTAAERGFPGKFVNVTDFNRPPENGHRKIPEVPALDKLLWAIDKFPYGPLALRGEDYLNSGWKRAFDLAVATGSLVVLAPVMAAAMAARKKENPYVNPLLKQPRHGSGWWKFGMFKIRSQDIDTAGTGQTSPTKVGSILRKTSIDEIPQFLNVLRGEMGVVGWRPTITEDHDWFYEWVQIHYPFEKAKEVLGFTKEQWEKGEISPEIQKQAEEFTDMVRQKSVPIYNKWKYSEPGKPGITGLQQIAGRRDLEHHQRMKLDLVYREHASLLLDAFIVIKTLEAVVSRRGAR